MESKKFILTAHHQNILLKKKVNNSYNILAKMLGFGFPTGEVENYDK